MGRPRVEDELVSRELRGRGEDGEVGVERLSVEAGHGGQQATHERVIFLVTRLTTEI